MSLFICSSLSVALRVELCYVAFSHCNSYEACSPFRRQECTVFQNIENFSACQRGVCPEYSILCLSIVINLNVICSSVSTPISNKQTRTEVGYISCEQQSHVLYIVISCKIISTRVLTKVSFSQNTTIYSIIIEYIVVF